MQKYFFLLLHETPAPKKLQFRDEFVHLVHHLVVELLQIDPRGFFGCMPQPFADDSGRRPQLFGERGPCMTGHVCRKDRVYAADGAQPFQIPVYAFEHRPILTMELPIVRSVEHGKDIFGVGIVLVENRSQLRRERHLQPLVRLMPEVPYRPIAYGAFLQKDDVHEGHSATEETEHEDVPRELKVRVSGKVRAINASDLLPVQGPLDGFARLGAYMLERIAGRHPIPLPFCLPVNRLQVAHIVAYRVGAHTALMQKRLVSADETRIDFRDAHLARTDELRHGSTGVPQSRFGSEPLQSVLVGGLQIHITQQVQFISVDIESRDYIRDDVCAPARLERSDMIVQSRVHQFDFPIEFADFTPAAHGVGDETYGLLPRVELLLEEFV